MQVNFAPDSPRARSPARSIPLELAREVGWLRVCVQTLLALLRHPYASFSVCPEPIDHGRVLRFLATLRLPLWLTVLALLGSKAAGQVGPEAIAILPVHRYVEPPLAEVISMWVLLLIPVGVPLLYFVGGLTAHIGVALTGGAARSIGATMRAVGYALAPALLAIGALDLPLYLGKVDGGVYVVAIAVVALVFLWQAGMALARTHQVSLSRGLLVSLLPLVVLTSVTLGRASLELADVPFLPPVSTSPYYVP